MHLDLSKLMLNVTLKRTLNNLLQACCLWLSAQLFAEMILTALTLNINLEVQLQVNAMVSKTLLRQRVRTPKAGIMVVVMLVLSTKVACVRMALLNLCRSGLRELHIITLRIIVAPVVSLLHLQLIWAARRQKMLITTYMELSQLEPLL